MTSHATASDEARVNTAASNDQADPSVAALADGGWIVTWKSLNQDGSLYGVYQQRYTVGGTASGVETLVNAAGHSQEFPSVTGLADGGWLVTWSSYPQDDGFSSGVYQRRYDSSGNATGVEQLVNTYTADDQSFSSVAALADGGWLVSWKSDGQDGNSVGVYQQRYHANGTTNGVETLVNTVITSYQGNPSVAALGDGGWVVTWMSDSQDSGGWGVYQQRYDATGTAVGIGTLVNVRELNDQRDPSVTGLADGGWVVTWMSMNQDGSDAGIYQRHYDASGNPGIETRVNSTTASAQAAPSVVVLADGGWVVTWKSLSQDGDSWGIYQQRYDEAGLAVGGETIVNATIINDQSDPSVTALADGGWLVTWQSLNQDGSGYGIYQRHFAADVLGGGGADTLSGTSWAELLSGGTGSDSLSGLGGDDTLLGGDDNDTLDGGVGNDSMDGGDGDDTYLIDSSSDDIAPDSGGTDTVVAAVSFSIAAYVDVENMTLVGFAEEATGNGLANVLAGNAEDNTLDGGAGDDTLRGHAGDDTYVVDSSSDIVIELDGEGNDTVESAVSHTLSANVEKLILTGSGNLSGGGNDLSNYLTGNAGDNTLLGGAGSDGLEGGDGNDSLDGGAGSNALYGGAGDDTLRSGVGADDTRLHGGEGIDFAIIDRSTHTRSFNIDIGDPAGGRAPVDFDVAQIERIDFTAGSGNDTITGGALADRVAGNAGRDMLAGGGGADTVLGGDGIDIVSGDAGNDSLRGGDGIDILDGGSDQDLIFGDGGNDSLDGGSGNDTIDGGSGYDVMSGGLGDDLYIVDSARDTLFEAAGEGTDTVFSSATFALDDDIEHLELRGAANIDGSGNALSNRLAGNAGANSLAGGLGSDSLAGGSGFDTLSGGIGRDDFVFNGIGDSRPKARTADRIVDFRHGRDEIDLRAIDANTTKLGDQAFVFDRIGTSKTAVAKGHIGWYQTDASGTANDATYLRINNDGDIAIDMVIRLDGLISLTKGDFLL